MKKSLLAFCKYFVLYFVSIVYLEIVVRLQIGDLLPSNLFFLFFVPAESMFFALFSGFSVRRINRFLTPIVMFVITVFYLAQCIYYESFGSLFSVSMAGMGTQAIGNFWWALKGTILESIWVILLLLVPFAASIVLSIIGKPTQDHIKWAMRGIILVSVVAFWFLGILGIMAFGKGKQSPYYIFNSSISDTDSTSSKFGALTTTIIEAGSYYLGIGRSADVTGDMGNDDFVVKVPSITDLTIPAKTPATGNEAETDTDISDTQKVETETKGPEYWIDSRIDFTKLAETTDDAKIKAICSYYATKTGNQKNDFTGLFDGYNLIYICAESFWTYAIDEKVTPTLYKMANNGIVLNNYYNSFKNTTTNGEYAFATSMWPDLSGKVNMGKLIGSFPQSSIRYMPQGLGKLFKSVGGTAYAFHNYKGSYYGRSSSWPNLGYECYFKGQGMKFTSSWPASDYEMMQQSVDKYINDERFNAYYMTFSGHGSYTFYDEYTLAEDGTIKTAQKGNIIARRNRSKVDELLGSNSKLNDKAKNYLACHYELDKAMEYLLTRLEEVGKLENTVIVIASDHYPYYINDNATYKALSGVKMDKTFGMYKSTCIIYNAGLKEPIVSDEFCCNVDILPTMLNLLNIPYESRLMMGTDIFSNGLHRALLYNQSFLTEYVSYDSESGTAHWTDLAADWSDEQKKNYLDAITNLNEADMSVSTHVLAEDFFKFVYKNSGIMTPEEEQAESERIANLNIDDVYNDMDEDDE